MMLYTHDLIHICCYLDNIRDHSFNLLIVVKFLCTQIMALQPPNQLSPTSSINSCILLSAYRGQTAKVKTQQIPYFKISRGASSSH